MDTWVDFGLTFHASSYQPAALSDVVPADHASEFLNLDKWICATRNLVLASRPDDPWVRYSRNLHLKLLRRGVSTFPQVEIGEEILDWMESSKPDFRAFTNDVPSDGAAIHLEEGAGGRAPFAPPRPIQIEREGFNPYDPEHPANESRLVRAILVRFGERLAAYLFPQVPLDAVLGPDFVGQRADFVVALPNGKGFVLEPGDHGEADRLRDDARDQAFFNVLGFPTLRPRNQEIESALFLEDVAKKLEEIGASKYLDLPERRYSRQIAVPHLGPWINRFESLLVSNAYGSDDWRRGRIEINVIERDFPATELAFRSFALQQQKIHSLYGKPWTPPEVTVRVYSLAPSDWTENNAVGNPLPPWIRITRLERIPRILPEAHLTIDASITSGLLELPCQSTVCGPLLVIRNFPFHCKARYFPTSPVVFTPPTRSEDSTIAPLGNRLESFLRDLFRKESFREGQVDIVGSLLRGNDTIGLLPTGAGKSLCYQLSGLLVPGTTLIVSPIIALMEDQVDSLCRKFRITACESINSQSKENPTASDIAGYLRTSLFLFISPERFQRASFREALQSPEIARHPVNLAVIDEAHCVSMWGHDFRPSYLRLPHSIRRFCRNADGRPPVVAALTGTASQLVLIDLKRLLAIDSPGSIIRPKTFDRKELHFRVRHTPKGDESKSRFLKENVFPEIQKSLGKRKLLTGSYGIIFHYKPMSLWKAMHEISPKSQEELSSYEGKGSGIPSLAIYTGSFPEKVAPSLEANWKTYKLEVFKRFCRGEIRCLLGNNAISVGIDHPDIEYVINLAMPQSLEDYYQQAGRAGRSGQQAYCYLLYGETAPANNDRWFADMGEYEKDSDVALAAYFHTQNFPGELADRKSMKSLLGGIVTRSPGSPDSTVILSPKSVSDVPAEQIERFLGYLILVGVVEDYTIKGFTPKASEFSIVLQSDFVSAVRAANFDAGFQHVLDSLLAYYSRYDAVDRSLVESEVKEMARAAGGKLLTAASQHLIRFVYRRIEYQRRNGIKLMADFCRKAVNDEKRARRIIRDTFDRSRFSERLLKMREKPVDLDALLGVILDIHDKSEAEQLSWETSRLLSELDRDDWSLVRVVALLYAEPSDANHEQLKRVVARILPSYGGPLLPVIATAVHRARGTEGYDRDCELVEEIAVTAYREEGTRQSLILALDDPRFPSPYRERISILITVEQLKRAHESVQSQFA